MPKPNYTKEEKKILWKSSLGCKIILVLCFLPWLFLSFLSFLYCEDGYAFVIVFWILTVPYVILALFAFRVQIFWSEEKQRNYIATKIKQQPVAEPKTITLSASEADAMYDSLKEEFQVLPRPAELKISGDGTLTVEDLSDLGPFTDYMALESKHKRLHSLYTEGELGRTLTKLYRSAKTSMEENGASTLYLTLGLLRWFEGKSSDVPRYAPHCFSTG